MEKEWRNIFVVIDRKKKIDPVNTLSIFLNIYGIKPTEVVIVQTTNRGGIDDVCNVDEVRIDMLIYVTKAALIPNGRTLLGF
ncbi:MAG: hypothetical protein WCS97_00150 [Candidatus Paceibacterota bacterium]|jgi:hypothetical protein